jgi:hypothetical protein
MNRSGWLVLGAALVAGCTADATDATGVATQTGVEKGNEPASASSAPGGQGTLLARATNASGQSVAFFEMAPGVIRAEETGAKGTQPLDEVAHASSFADAYRLVSSSRELPTALAEAQVRFKAAVVSPATKLAAPEKVPTPELAGRIKPMNTPTENWFQQHFCSSTVTAYCEFSNSGSVGVPWSYAFSYTEVFMDDPSDETDAVMTDYLWSGGTWVADFHVATAPGTWTSERWFSVNEFYREASVAGGSGPGGVAPVALETEVRNAYLDVSYAGQWVYSGGWFINDTLVSIYPLNPPAGADGTGSGEASVSTNGYGTFSTVAPVWCGSSTATSFSFKAVGYNTGETVYATAPTNYCWE